MSNSQFTHQEFTHQGRIDNGRPASRRFPAARCAGRIPGRILNQGCTPNSTKHDLLLWTQSYFSSFPPRGRTRPSTAAVCSMNRIRGLRWTYKPLESMEPTVQILRISPVCNAWEHYAGAKWGWGRWRARPAKKAGGWGLRRAGRGVVWRRRRLQSDGRLLPVMRRAEEPIPRPLISRARR